MDKELKEKLNKVFGNAKDVDGILIMNTDNVDPNFIYITGFTSGIFEFSYLFIEKTGVTLLTSSLEYETAKEQEIKGIEVALIDKTEGLHERLDKFMNGRAIGLNEMFIPHYFYNKIVDKHQPEKVVDVSEALSNARLIKSEKEIDKIRQAISATKWAMFMIQKEFKEGITEKETATKFDNIAASLGSQEPAFKTIVCFGKNSALPHHSPDETKLKYGDLVLIDAGAKIDNYCADLTRTSIFGEDKEKIPDYERKKQLIKIVKDAQLKAIRAIKPGMKGKEIHNIAQDYIDTIKDGEFKGKFTHSLGHSVGIEVHDGPGFSPKAEQILKSDMVITAEPGIYLPGFGGVRIEDDVLITKEGEEVL